MEELQVIELHPKRHLMVKELVAGAKVGEVAEKYEVDPKALDKYFKKRVLPRAAKVMWNRGAREGKRVVKQLQDIQKIVKRVLDEELANKNSPMVLAAAKEFRAGAELLSRIFGILKPDTIIQNINIRHTTVWVELKDIIYQATEGYPEVREKIASAIMRHIGDSE